MKRALPCLLLFLAASCAPPAVGPGARVRLRYEMSVDGKTVESDELEFLVGSGRIRPALEEALVGLQAGDEKTVALTSAYDPKAVERMPLEKFKGLEASLKPGATIQGMRAGKLAQARVVSVGPRDVVLDFNEPRAGQTLRFQVAILDVRRP